LDDSNGPEGESLTSGRTLPTANSNGYWPTPAQQLLLRAAFGIGDNAARAWREWRQTHELRELDNGSYRLLPLVYHNLNFIGLADPALPALKRVSLESWRNLNVLMHAVAPRLQALEEAGLQPLLLKGLPLALAYYPAPNLRPMGDCDILVRPRHAEPALAVLERAGWTHPGLGPLSTATSCSNGRGQSIDLHQNAFFQCPYDRHDEALWTRARPLIVEGVTTRALSPSDQFFYVCVHGLRWDPTPPVRWAADLMILLRHQEGIDWKLVVSLAKSRRLVLPVRQALEYLHRTFEAPVPEEVLRELQAAPVAWLYRREQEAWSRPPQLTDGFWIKWARYSRLRLNGDPKYRVNAVTYFRDAWNVPRRRDLPALLFRRTLVKLRERSV
jgi:hypothetical protein